MIDATSWSKTGLIFIDLFLERFLKRIFKVVMKLESEVLFRQGGSFLGTTSTTVPVG